MIRKLDKLWFELLRATYRWLVRRAKAHSQREKVRRFRRHLAWQNTSLN
jgi:hypothetical protein